MSCKHPRIKTYYQTQTVTIECGTCGATASGSLEGRSREETQHLLIDQIASSKSASLQHNVHEISALSEENQQHQNS